MLNQLSSLQEVFRGYLLEMDEKQDRDFREAFVSAPGLERDQVIALAVIAHESFPRHLPGEEHDDDGEMVMGELIIAGEIIDHLDTLGWKLTRK